MPCLKVSLESDAPIGMHVKLSCGHLVVLQVSARSSRLGWWLRRHRKRRGLSHMLSRLTGVACFTILHFIRPHRRSRHTSLDEAFECRLSPENSPEHVVEESPVLRHYISEPLIFSRPLRHTFSLSLSINTSLACSTIYSPRPLSLAPALTQKVANRICNRRPPTLVLHSLPA